MQLAVQLSKLAELVLMLAVQNPLLLKQMLQRPVLVMLPVVLLLLTEQLSLQILQLMLLSSVHLVVKMMRQLVMMQLHFVKYLRPVLIQMQMLLKL